MQTTTPKRRLLIVEDDPITADLLSHQSIRHGYVPQVCSTARAAEGCDWRNLSAVILDLHLPDGDGFDLLGKASKLHPDLPCFVLSARDSAEAAVAALKTGAHDYFTKPVEPSRLFSTIDGTLGNNTPAESRPSTPALNGEWKSKAMTQLHRTAQTAATNDTGTLLVGQQGTGKRAIAQWIHLHSRRASRPFATIDASVLDPETLAAELFGGEVRQPSGRIARIRGRIEICHGGTLYLENIQALPHTLQKALLSALEMRPEAGTSSRSDFRLIASCRTDLKSLVDRGEFRQDLYYRLSTQILRCPCLYEAPQDIPTWAERILTDICITQKCRRPSLSAGAREALMDHLWPGNLNEMRRALEQAVTRCAGGIISLNDLPPLESQSSPSIDSSTPANLSHCRIADLELAALIAALDACDGNRRRAAKRLGVSLRTIFNKIDRYNLRDYQPRSRQS